MSFLDRIMMLLENEKSSAIIVDLDGCLCPIEPRLDSLKSKDWDTFHSTAKDQDPSPWCVEIIKKFAPDHTILFVSGRPNTYFGETWQWIKDATGLNNFLLYLNQPYDPKTFIPDHEFKVNIYRNEIESNYNVLFVIDDRPTVVQAWRDMGLTVLQPNFIEH